MRSLTRGSAVAIAAAALLALGQTAASAATTSGWYNAWTCATPTLSGCSIYAQSSSTLASADDGGCANQVGISVKSGSGGAISSAVFANTYAAISGANITHYKAWHL